MMMTCSPSSDTQVPASDRRWADLHSDGEEEEISDMYDREESLRRLAAHNFTHDSYDLAGLASKEEELELDGNVVQEPVKGLPANESALRQEAAAEEVQADAGKVDRQEVLKEALALARKLRQHAVSVEPQTQTQACQTDVQAEAVIRLEAVRGRLLQRRRLEERGTLAERQAQLAAKRELVEKVKAEILEVQMAQGARRRQQAQDISNLEREIQEAEEKRRPPPNADKKEIQELRKELQALQSENQSMLEDVKKMRESESHVKREIEAAEAETRELQDAMQTARAEMAAIEQKLARLKERHADPKAAPAVCRAALVAGASNAFSGAFERMLHWSREEFLVDHKGLQARQKALLKLLGAGCLAAAVLGAHLSRKPRSAIR